MCNHKNIKYPAVSLATTALYLGTHHDQNDALLTDDDTSSVIVILKWSLREGWRGSLGSRYLVHIDILISPRRASEANVHVTQGLTGLGALGLSEHGGSTAGARRRHESFCVCTLVLTIVLKA